MPDIELAVDGVRVSIFDGLKVRVVINCFLSGFELAARNEIKIKRKLTWLHAQLAERYRSRNDWASTSTGRQSCLSYLRIWSHGTATCGTPSTCDIG